MEMPTTIPKVGSVRPVEGRVVELTFDDGSERVVDLAPRLWGPMFDEIATDDARFSAVFVDDELGTICWPNGADLAPETLFAADASTASKPVSAQA
jgi:hypothetical protein